MLTGSEQTGNPQKSKGGRPKKAAPRSAVLVVRLTPAERVRIEQKAAQAGMKTGEWFRKAAISAVVKARMSVEEMAFTRSLSGLCNNLNQLTKLAHQEGLISQAARFSSLLKEVTLLLDKIKHDDR